MQSHIQMPEVVLKEFVNEDKYYYKYEVATGKITKGYPKRTYTQEDYYSQEIETAFNNYVENPMKSVINFAKNNLSYSIVEIDPQIEFRVYNYIKSLIARSERLLGYVHESSVYFQFMKKQSQHDWTADFAMTNISIDDLEKDFSVSFLINKTDVPFVLPTCGMCECNIRDRISILVPITPYHALWLTRYDDVNKKAIFNVCEDSVELINAINRMLFQKQLGENVGYVVSANKPILEALDHCFATND